MNESEPEFRPPPAFRRLAESLEAGGYEAWAVGGALRDELLGLGHGDWDLATDARPEEVRRIFRRTVPVGIEHGTVGVLADDGQLYEVTTFRLDVETDGRHATVRFADSIEEDLARRDFTINALAWRPATHELRDPFQGRRDLERRVLRAVGDPSERFAEDYLRVLRGLRFAGGLGLSLDPATDAALRAASGHLGRLSAERVREELMKVLSGPTPSAALRLYGEAGALDAWYPEVAETARNDARWELNLAAVDAIRASRPLLRLVRWLLPEASAAEESGRDPAGSPAREHGSDREAVGREARGLEVLRRLRFSNAEQRRVGRLLRFYLPLVGPMDSSARIRQWLAEVTPDAARDLFRLHFADARAAGGAEKARYLVAAWRRVHEELLDAPPLSLSDLAVRGDDLLALGVSPGPAVGLLLDELHQEVLEDPELNRLDELLARARELIEMAHLAPPSASGERRGESREGGP
ncbi:MAG: CCA tRNA nucleotidyltransferase [Gemmatimonadota bacterium]